MIVIQFKEGQEVRGDGTRQLCIRAEKVIRDLFMAYKPVNFKLLKERFTGDTVVLEPVDPRREAIAVMEYLNDLLKEVAGDLILYENFPDMVPKAMRVK